MIIAGARPAAAVSHRESDGSLAVDARRAPRPAAGGGRQRGGFGVGAADPGPRRGRAPRRASRACEWRASARA